MSHYESRYQGDTRDVLTEPKYAGNSSATLQPSQGGLERIGSALEQLHQMLSLSADKLHDLKSRTLGSYPDPTTAETPIKRPPPNGAIESILELVAINYQMAESIQNSTRILFKDI